MPKTDLTGKTLGKWKVGEKISNAKGKDRRSHRGSFYMCTCECGSTVKVLATNLSRGLSTQCQTCQGKTYKVTICIRGHDTSVCGRTKTYECRMCAKEKSIKYAYGLTIEDYVALYEFQGGKCAICGRPLALLKTQGQPNTLGRTEVDHKHVLKSEKIKPPKKDTVRGLLCGGRWSGCNIKLGKVDKIEWMTAALKYLKNPPAHQLFGKGKMSE